jgi:hypothetical protein
MCQLCPAAVAAVAKDAAAYFQAAPAAKQLFRLYYMQNQALYQL